MGENISRRMNLDTLGISASLLCAVHCAVLPLLLGALPLLGFELAENEMLEYGLLLLSFLIGCISLGRGYIRHHRRLMPLLLFAAGFALLLAGHFIPQAALAEYYLICFGAAGIIAAHLINLRQSRHCRVHKH
ncbi:MerC domain-containing protein [Chitinophaga solisilvae]|uniref:MerC domain-containing protein n=1 Tax=Chitinophaga solisilvae TaxID=1233460 RepID=UPI00136B9664|nr:MerC domain-containing protein [Chitinophaga solisilvae]